MREIDERDCQNGMAYTQQDELESLRKDAMRYRFLRESRNAYPLCFIAQRDPHNVVVQFTGELADATIDALMVPNAPHEGRPD